MNIGLSMRRYRADRQVQPPVYADICLLPLPDTDTAIIIVDALGRPGLIDGSDGGDQPLNALSPADGFECEFVVGLGAGIHVGVDAAGTYQTDNDAARRKLDT